MYYSPHKSPRKPESTDPLDPPRTRKDDCSWERMRTHPERNPAAPKLPHQHNGRGGRTREPMHTRIITHPFATHSQVATHMLEKHTKRKKKERIRREKIPTAANLVLHGQAVWALRSSTSPLRYGHPSPDVIVLPAGVSLPPLQGRKLLWASLALPWVLTPSCLGGRGQVCFSCSCVLLLPSIGPLHQPATECDC